MKGLKKSVLSLVLAMAMLLGMVVPQTNVQAASVKVIVSEKTKTYSKKKTYAYVNGKKVKFSKEPAFMKNGSYMGSAIKLFRDSSLNVTYKDSKHKKLTLTYNGHVLQMTHGKKVALLDGKKTEFGTAPIYATYKSSGKKRWIVPVKSVCTRLEIDYRLSGNVMYLEGNSNGTTNSSDNGNSSPKGKFILVLDAGHGGNDSGAVADGVAEKKLTLEILLAAKKKFDKDSRFKVYYTRTSDTYPALSDRASLANKVKADTFISVHINCADSTKANGSETLYDPNRVSKTKKNGIDSLNLATAMQKSLLASTGFNDRGLVKRCSCSSCRKKGLSLCVLRETDMPACLLEYGFISNTKERRAMVANTSKYGKDLYNGIVSYLKSKGKIN